MTLDTNKWGRDKFKVKRSGHWERKCKNIFRASIYEMWINLRQTVTSMDMCQLQKHVIFTLRALCS